MAFVLPPRSAIRPATYAVGSRLDAPGFVVGGCFVRDRRTAEAIATVIQTVADADRRFALVTGLVLNERENVAGWSGWLAAAQGSEETMAPSATGDPRTA